LGIERREKLNVDRRRNAADPHLDRPPSGRARTPIRVGIVVPTLDEAGVIEARLRALQPHRDAGHLVVVSDGGSKDGTAERAAPYADRLLHGAAGRARQMNAGAEAARAAGADVFLFLHADTALPASALDAVAAALADGRCAWGRFDVRIDGRSRWLPLIAASMNLRSRLSGIATGDQAIFATAVAFARAGRFPEWPLMEDIALSRALKRVSRPAALREKVVTAGRRWDANGAWSTIVLMWWLRLRFFLGTKPERLVASYTTVR
jgi:rSAM/selenodomain-associated transferase 2